MAYHIIAQVPPYPRRLISRGVIDYATLVGELRLPRLVVFDYVEDV
jgi:phosphoenolpyruvate carboxylase